MTIAFTKAAAANTWTFDVTLPAGTTTNGNGPPDVVIDDNTLSFDASGVLQGAADRTIDIINLSNGANPLSITWDLYDATGVSNGDLTQYAAPSSTNFQTQDGYPSGTLRTVDVDEFGVVTGSYSNGQLTALFQLTMADFPSYYGLTKMGKNLYTESLNSGPALFGTPQSGRLGSISTSSIEMSNVDLAAEFVKMITTQRAFQANSRVITTSDEILNELINLKR